MNNTYAIGTEITLQGTIRDLDGALADPTTVECEVINPARTITTCTVTKLSTGLYEATFVPTMAGGHSYKFKGTGNITVAAFGGFNAAGTF